MIDLLALTPAQTEILDYGITLAILEYRNARKRIRISCPGDSGPRSLPRMIAIAERLQKGLRHLIASDAKHTAALAPIEK